MRHAAAMYPSTGPAEEVKGLAEMVVSAFSSDGCTAFVNAFAEPVSNAALDQIA